MLKSKVEGKIKALKKLPMKTKIVIAVGLAGILLIFVSEMFPAKNTAESKSIPTESVATDDTDSYKKQIEKELKDVLSQVRGSWRVQGNGEQLRELPNMFMPKILPKAQTIMVTEQATDMKTR